RRVVLGARLGDLSYALSCGMPKPGPGLWGEATLFNLDPEVKEEKISFTADRHPVVLLDRGVSSVWVRDADGRRVSFPMALSASESVLAQLQEPHRFPQLSALRQEILSWRFYHLFRTDPDAALRHPQVGARTPVLSHDGRDLAAALQTIREIGGTKELEEA